MLIIYFKFVANIVEGKSPCFVIDFYTDDKKAENSIDLIGNICIARLTEPDSTQLSENDMYVGDLATDIIFNRASGRVTFRLADGIVDKHDIVILENGAEFQNERYSLQTCDLNNLGSCQSIVIRSKTGRNSLIRFF